MSLLKSTNPALIQGPLSPRIDRKAILVFAADHGITEEGVSAYPAEATGQMVNNFLDVGAAINVLCRHHGIDIVGAACRIMREMASFDEAEVSKKG